MDSIIGMIGEFITMVQNGQTMKPTFLKMTIQNCQVTLILHGVHPKWESDTFQKGLRIIPLKLTTLNREWITWVLSNTSMVSVIMKFILMI